VTRVYQLLLDVTPASSPSPLQGGAFQIILNVIGGFITVALIGLCGWFRARLRRRKFKGVFGEDVFSSDFHLVYAELKLRPLIDDGKPDKHPYRKPGEEHLGAKFSIERPVSSSETRAAKYLAETIGREVKGAPLLSSDVDMRGRLDVSFISFGGPLSNLKPRDIIENPSNDLIKFDNEKFTTSKSEDCMQPQTWVRLWLDLEDSPEPVP
jgi:hypothetical protein